VALPGGTIADDWRLGVEELDVVIVGAGLSGIGAACRLKTMCAGKSYAILEARGALGGTWDLFRYPGIRSDSDMFTLSYPFRPWREAESIADGPTILEYLRQSAAELAVDRHIRFHHRVVSASWSSSESRWMIGAEAGEQRELVRYSARFLYLCSGYYSYESGNRPEFPDAEAFQGPIIHPQEWPEGLDYHDQRVVIIGSGATAITLAPALADGGAHVTVLQRSPSYVVSLPAVDPLSARVRSLLPEPLAYRVLRWKNLLFAMAVYQVCRRRPRLARRLLRRGTSRQLPDGYEVDPNFMPGYDPWDQRMCVAPDGDLFKAISSGRVTMITDQIQRFTPGGIRLRSGEELDADLIVSATGLTLVACGGIRLEVDGREVQPGKTVIYRGFMLSDVPNLAMCFGYTNASWTLRADLVSQDVCRLINQMDQDGFTQAVPRLAGADIGEVRPLLDLSSGYVTRSAHKWPQRGTRGPWRFRQNYILDLISTRLGGMGRDLSFSGPPRAADPVTVGAPTPDDAVVAATAEN
jgi:monooxygenase